MHPSETSQPIDHFSRIAKQALREIPLLPALHNNVAKQADFSYARHQHLFSKEASINVMLVDELSDLLLNLWQLVNGNPFGNLLEKLLNLTGCYVPFDSTVWGYTHQDSTNQNLQPRIIFKLGAPDEGIQKYICPNSLQVFAQSGTAFRYDYDNPEPDIAPELLAFYRSNGIRHTCGVQHKHNGIGLFILLHRNSDKSHFSAQEAHFLEIIIGHLNAAIEVYCNRLLVTGKNRLGADGGVALINPSSQLLLADETFHMLVSRHWPGRQESGLPEALLDRDVTKPVKGLIASKIPIPGEQFYLLSLRPQHVLDRLSARQIEIARAYANGMAYKHIARTLHLSPSTVRNHLSNIYNELQINNKAELIAAFGNYSA